MVPVQSLIAKSDLIWRGVDMTVSDDIHGGLCKARRDTNMRMDVRNSHEKTLFEIMTMMNCEWEMREELFRGN